MSKHEPIFFNRNTMEDSLSDFLNIVNEHADAKGVTVSFKIGKESRASIQNSLAHVWKGQIARFMNEDDLDRQWGEMKLLHLHPTKQLVPTFQDEHIEELEVLESLAVSLRTTLKFGPMTDYQRRCHAANIAVRSNNLPVAFFARWLDRLQRVYEREGLHLVATKRTQKALLTEKERNALDKEREERRAA